MKTIGKIKMRLRERAEPINHLDVSRENPTQDKKTQNNDEMHELIRRLVEVLEEKKQCDVDALLDLSDKYRQYQKGQIVAEEFLSFLEFLLVEAVNDCDEIIVSFVTGCSDGKENDYERT